MQSERQRIRHGRDLTLERLSLVDVTLMSISESYRAKSDDRQTKLDGFRAPSYEEILVRESAESAIDGKPIAVCKLKMNGAASEKAWLLQQPSGNQRLTPTLKYAHLPFSNLCSKGVISHYRPRSYLLAALVAAPEIDNMVSDVEEQQKGRPQEDLRDDATEPP